LTQASRESRGAIILSIQALLSSAPDQHAALLFLKKLLKNDLSIAEAQFALGLQELQVNNYNEAKTSFLNAIRIKPYSEQFALAIARFDSTERLRATQIVKDYIAKHEGVQSNEDLLKKRDARVALAQLYLGEGKLPEAREQFELIKKEQPSDLVPLFAIGVIDVQEKRWDSAVLHLKEYLAAVERQMAVLTQSTNTQSNLQIDTGQAYLLLAQIAIQRGEGVEARRFLMKVPSYSAVYFEAQIINAQLLSQARHYDEALRVVSQADPRNLQEIIIMQRAQAALLMLLERYAEAEKLLAKLIKAMPENIELAYDYAMAAERNGQFEKMENELNRIIAFDPNNAQALNALGYSLVDRNERLDEAERLLTRALAQAPEDPFILDSFAWLKFRQGKLIESQMLFKQLFSRFPSAEVGAHFGEVLWALGQHDLAKAIWSKAKELDPSDKTLVDTMKRFSIK
jgi:tetratricopeptide (TPR) repeat protein